jgi:hypothetical protein
MCAVGTVEVFQWASIPELLREQYRWHFVDGATAIGDNFTVEPPDDFADAVWKRIISAKRLRPSYLIAPPQVAVVPWLPPAPSPAGTEHLAGARMFSRKPGAWLAKHRNGGTSAALPH